MKIKGAGLLMMLVTLTSCGGVEDSQLPSTPGTSSEISESSELPSESISSEPSQTPSSEEKPPLKESILRYAPVPDGVNQYNHSELYVGDINIPLMAVKTNYSQQWDGLAPNRYDAGVGVVELEGRVTFSLRTENFGVNAKSVIRPLAAGIELQLHEDNKGFDFVISSPGNYVIEPNNERIAAVHLFVREISDDSEYINNPNVIYFGPGLHDASNDERLSDSIIQVKRGQTVYLAFGAVVRARFVASHQNDIQIIGNGVVDGSTFPRIAGQPSGNTQFVPFDFSWCSNLYFADFIILDPAGWTVNWYFVEDSSIDNIAIITSRSNGDGITLQSCQDIDVKNSFVRGWDDTLVVKNYPDWRNREVEGTTRNISFSNMILWVDLAQAMEIGYETVGTVMENIVFTDITVLHALHKPIISIHNANNAHIKNVTFKNITVDDGSMGRGDAGDNEQLIDIVNIFSNNWSTNHKITSMGQIDGVLVENVKVLTGNDNIPIRISGAYDGRSNYLSEHWVKNINIIDIEIKGTVLTNQYEHFNIGPYTENISLTASGNQIDGATYIPMVSSENAVLYEKTASVYMI